IYVFFFSSRRRHTRWPRDWSSDVCSSDLPDAGESSAGHNGEKTGDAKQRAKEKPARRGIRAGHFDRRRGIGGRERRSGAVELGEIGRASCRERGESAEGEVAVKRKRIEGR